MGELVIQTHSFETSKDQLKKFSEQTATELDLKRVHTSKSLGEWLLGGGVGLNHKVTGGELNKITSQIQTHFIGINALLISLIQEFGQVYNALEALDRDYIQAILIAIKSAQKANDDIKEAQSDIDKTIAMQKKTIKVLEKFKEKIDKSKHLIDIDKMWQDIQNAQCSIKALEKASKAMDSSISSHSQKLESFDKLKSVIDSLESLDGIYGDYQEFKTDIAVLKDTISNQEQVISELKINLFDQQNKAQNVEKILSKKVRIAYLLAGSSLGLVVLEFILVMMGLI